MPLVTIASFRDPPLAHIAKAKLEAEGIPAFVVDEHLIGVHPLTSDALGGVKLRVPDDFAEHAREIVSRDHSSEVRALRKRPLRRSGDHCPACGSAAVSTAIEARETAVQRSGARIVLWTNDRGCDDCGMSW